MSNDKNESPISKEMRVNQMKAIDVYISLADEDDSVKRFLKEISKKLIAYLEPKDKTT